MLNHVFQLILVYFTWTFFNDSTRNFTTSGTMYGITVVDPILFFQNFSRTEILTFFTVFICCICGNVFKLTNVHKQF